MCIMSYNCSVKCTIDAINVVCAIYEMPSEILFIIVSWKQLLDFGYYHDNNNFISGNIYFGSFDTIYNILYKYILYVFQ